LPLPKHSTLNGNFDMNSTTPSNSSKVALRFAQVGEVKVFYREAGDRAHPTLLLLHGFPTSSHMFRELVPLLAERFHVVAPDLPGFGFTVAPQRGAFDYTFENLTNVVAKFVDTIGLDRFALYVFDYGAPVGFRLALARPDMVTAIVSQNGNAYEEGLSAGWTPIQAYWSDPSRQNRDALRSLLTLETTQWQYVHGTPDASQVAPEAYWLDYVLMQREGNAEIQLDLFRDYASNVALYPRFQEYFARARPRLLAIWGKNDPFFLPAGAEAFRRDNPSAEVRLLDTGHFALETHVLEVAAAIEKFLNPAAA
jgi:pimeloyl-ACP methyl ester carboxylesterase